MSEDVEDLDQTILGGLNILHHAALKKIKIIPRIFISFIRFAFLS